MRRNLFTLAAAVSAVAFIAACVLWARSYRRSDTAGYARIADGAAASRQLGPVVSVYLVGSTQGRLAVGWARLERGMLPRWIQPGWVHHVEPIDRRQVQTSGFWGGLGFDYYDRAMSADGRNRVRRIMVPWWSVALAAAALPALGLATFLRRRRQIRAGLCLLCGYDLRATPDRCPECGAVPDRAPGRQRGITERQ